MDDSPNNYEDEDYSGGSPELSEEAQLLYRIDERMQAVDKKLDRKIEAHEQELQELNQRTEEIDNRSRKNRTIISIMTGGLVTLGSALQFKLKAIVSFLAKL